MSSKQVFLGISFMALVLIAVFMLAAFKNKKVQRLTPLAGIGFGFILVGMFFGNTREIGYSLLGIGVVLAVMDIVKRPKIT